MARSRYDSLGYLPLHWAVESDFSPQAHRQVVALLLEHSAGRIDAPIRPLDGSRPSRKYDGAADAIGLAVGDSYAAEGESFPCFPRLHWVAVPQALRARRVSRRRRWRGRRIECATPSRGRAPDPRGVPRVHQVLRSRHARP
jgi:hypothetical protein